MIGIELALSAAVSAGGAARYVFYSGAEKERDDHLKLAIKADIKEERTTLCCKIKINAQPLFPRLEGTHVSDHRECEIELGRAPFRPRKTYCDTHAKPSDQMACK